MSKTLPCFRCRNSFYPCKTCQEDIAIELLEEEIAKADLLGD